MALLQDIGLLDAAKESRELMEEEFRKDNELRSEMFIILKQEEVYWKQRARVTWLKEGDENISYFHSVANGRKNQNFIPWVWHEDQRVDDIGRMGDSFISYYKDLFGSAKEQHFQINWPNLLGPKAHNDLTMLDAPFTLDKIKVAVFGMKAEKDPRPDGFPIFFFLKFWGIVKVDIFKLCDDLFLGKANLERINWASIALIPKCQTPKNPSHFSSH